MESLHTLGSQTKLSRVLIWSSLLCTEEFLSKKGYAVETLGLSYPLRCEFTPLGFERTSERIVSSQLELKCEPVRTLSTEQ
eukprot:scaffold13838_cov104-Skeletonema_dohrnii-CCMP3373.AAC.5